MCRLSALVSAEYISPMEPILALETMKEGHDGSGLGLIMRDLGGEFESLKEYPVLSAITTHDGYHTLQDYMVDKGFRVKHRWEPRLKVTPGMKIQKRDKYLVNLYEYPESYEEATSEEKAALLTRTRLELRALGEADKSITVFSFWPDVVTLKEVGDPLEVGEFFGLDKNPVTAKTVFAQGRQNTNYAINLYACHPFFIQGYFTMTNGENTAFIPIREYLGSRGVEGYVGYNSDSEVFAHILHYTRKKLGYPLSYYKDVITPLKGEEMQRRPDAAILELMKRSLRMLTIDGPNCVIGCDIDGTVFMTQDAKKLRPGVVGGVNGRVGFMSEVCGLSEAVPGRDTSNDVFPMKYDLVMVRPGAKEIEVWNQLNGSMSTISLG
ncbi:MAG: glutamate synthase [Deltaproteobacteria bacterium]|nr:MAG: glutamate synthase [Deltaproteobacteria bacterium]